MRNRFEDHSAKNASPLANRGQNFPVFPDFPGCCPRRTTGDPGMSGKTGKTGKFQPPAARTIGFPSSPGGRRTRAARECRERFLPPPAGGCDFARRPQALDRVTSVSSDACSGEPRAHAVHLEDADMVGQAIRQGTGQPLGAEDAG
jgi:hypothetical protein